MIAKKFFFQDADELKLCGILSLPKSIKDRERTPIMILCHGLSSSKDSQTYVSLEEVLNNQGIATFRIDLFGHGESEGDFQDLTLSKAVENFETIISFLQKQGFKRFGLLASSFAANAGLTFVSKSNNLEVLILNSPVSDYKEKVKEDKTQQELDQWRDNGYCTYVNSDGEKFRLNHTFVEDFDNHDGYTHAKSINIPTLIIHGELDQSISVKQSIRLASVIKNSELHVIKGDDHRHSQEKNFKKMLQLVKNFVKSNFKGKNENKRF